ncbi:MAG: YdcF family protein [Ferruginibacter sp.]
MQIGKAGISKVIFIAIVLSFQSFCITAQNTRSPNPGYHLLAGKDFVTAKNYYLLSLFDQLPGVKKLLAGDVTLSAIAKTKADSLAAALTNCGRDGHCFISRMQFTEGEIKAVSDCLASLYQVGNPLDKLVQNHLIPSGTYVLFQNLPAKEMLLKAWEQDAAGINFCIGVYAGGNTPNYPLIDSISFNTRDPANSNVYRYGYVSLLYNACSLVALESKNKPSFFAPSLTCALRFLEMNEREQAADFEPMQEGENIGAAERIKTIDWKKYKYSVILIPGAGPDEPSVALSAEGMLRCRLGALQYKNGMAPFIVVSGGRVHPYKTPFCEATEMKQYLIRKLNIPPNAIIIDPHARHTTTNMRNTARIIYRYGIPFDKPAITCTTKGQSSMISNTLIDRCLKELNEVPYKNGQRLSETEVEFYPLIEALQINPKEPMDP